MDNGSSMKAYFEEFMETLQRQSLLGMTNLLVWLWLSKTKRAKVHIILYMHEPMFQEIYNWCYSDYYPISNDRLNNWPAYYKL